MASKIFRQAKLEMTSLSFLGYRPFNFAAAHTTNRRNIHFSLELYESKTKKNVSSSNPFWPKRPRLPSYQRIEVQAKWLIAHNTLPQSFLVFCTTFRFRKNFIWFLNESLVLERVNLRRNRHKRYFTISHPAKTYPITKGEFERFSAKLRNVTHFLYLQESLQQNYTISSSSSLSNSFRSRIFLWYWTFIKF